ncbi:MAG: DUF3857 domain-containing protein [Pyrinomonadaceae bacterium]
MNKSLKLITINVLVVTLSVAFLSTQAAFSQTKKSTKTKKSVRAVKLVTSPPAIVPIAKAEPKTVGLSIERYISNIDVASDGTFVQTLEVLQRFNSKTAIDHFKRVEKIFNRDLEEIEVSDTYILKANGRKIATPASAVEIKRTPQAEAAPSFSSMMMVEINFDGMEVGDAAHYSLKFRKKKTFFDKHFDQIDYLASIFDWKSAEINLSAPLDYPIFIEAVGLDGGRLPDSDGRARWQWKKKEQPALEVEMLMFDIIATSSRVLMTSFKNFDELGAAYWKEASNKSIVSPEIATLADEITKDITTPEKQANAIYLWVNKNIRYLSIVADRSGWIPHNANDILANRYGDCKDYATILNTLLKAKGIESYPVIIRADLGEWFPTVAAPSYFNHAILYIPSLDLFADGTSPNSRLGLIPQHIVGKQGFLAGSKTGVIETPANRPDDNQMVSSVNVELSPTGNLKARSVNAYIGRAELLFRPILSDTTFTEKGLVPFMLAYYGLSGNGKLIKVSDPFQVGEPLEAEFEVELDNYTTFNPAGSFRLPLGVNLNNITVLADLVKEEKRTTSLVLGAIRLKETYRIKFPDGVTPEIPANSSLSNGVVSFRNEFKLIDDKVEVLREIVINKDNITIDEYSKAREVIVKAGEAFQTEIKYSAKPDLFLAKSKQLARKPVDPVKAAYEAYTGMMNDGKPFVTAREAKKLEAKLLADPSDADARVKLVVFYSDMNGKDTPARKSARTKHRLWLIENRPDKNDADMFLFQLVNFKPADKDYLTLKNAWLKQIEANKANSKTRINAFTFIKNIEPDVAANILLAGQQFDPDKYELFLLQAQLYESEVPGVGKETPVQRSERLRKLLENGRVALAALKKERSDERDNKRRHLLQNIAMAAYELGLDEDAKTFATELILDFGQNAADLGYDDAAHIGNIILGRVALRKKDLSKAKEYLLIAIRAPLRKSNSWLGEIDMKLAKELLAVDEREIVIEYLRLCEGLSNLKSEKKLFENQSKALKLWQQQIKQGKTPTFDFYN